VARAGLDASRWFALKRLNEIVSARLENSIVKGAGVASSTELHLSNDSGVNSFWLALISVPARISRSSRT